MQEDLPDLAALLPSWRLAMQAEHKAPGTIKTYTDGVRLFLRWCELTDIPAEITRRNVQAWIADLLAGGAESATAVARQKGVRQFAKWLAAEGEIEGDDPLIGLKRPQQHRKVVQALTEHQLRALIGACRGKALKDRRDEAIVRLFIETGMRATELLSLTIPDINLVSGSATVRRGKGGKGRTVPFGAQTATAIDRYLRIARREGLVTDTGPLWTGVGGRTFGYHGLDETLKHRAHAASIARFHIHLLRHTFATRWKAAQGTDDGLMAVAGWSSRAMIDRYAGAAAAQRAAEEAGRLNLGDL